MTVASSVSHVINAFRLGHIREIPFRHFVAAELLPAKPAFEILDWLERTDAWQKREEVGFYRCSGFRVTERVLPQCVRFLLEAEFVAAIRSELCKLFQLPLEKQVQVGAQLLEDNDEMLVHTDFGPDCQAVRAIVHFNRGWSVDNGGLFVVLDNAIEPRNSQVYVPQNNSLFAFPVSCDSHHGVTLVRHGRRYSLAFSFVSTQGVLK